MFFATPISVNFWAVWKAVDEPMTPPPRMTTSSDDGVDCDALEIDAYGR